MHVDQTVHLNIHFEKETYKKISSRLHFLSKLYSSLTIKTPFHVYQTIIVLLFLFNFNVNLNFTRTQMEKLDSSQKRGQWKIIIL